MQNYVSYMYGTYCSASLLNTSYSYLLSIPRYENDSILGANWLTTEWYPSKQLVCPAEEDFFMALTSVVLVKISHSLPYAGDSAIKNAR